MGKWTKNEALDYLDSRITEIESLKRVGRFSAAHTRWITNTLVFLEEVFGINSYYHANIKSLSWRFTGSYIVEVWDFDGEKERLNQEAYIEQLESARGFLLAAQDYLSARKIEDVYTAPKNTQTTKELMKIFSLSESKLRKTIRTQPTKEKEVQDSFENLLIGAEIDYKREYPHIQYSTKEFIPDFSFENIGLAVEVKLCNANEKALIQQLNDDILAYKTQFPNVLFIIYDLGVIRDVDKFKQSFENSENVIVHVIKH